MGWSDIFRTFPHAHFPDIQCPRCEPFRRFRNQTVDLPRLQWSSIYNQAYGLWARNDGQNNRGGAAEDRQTEQPDFGEGGYMTTPEEQITPADAAIVSTGTGTKAPRSVIFPIPQRRHGSVSADSARRTGRIRPELLAKFDTVRQYAVKASAEHFAEPEGYESRSGWPEEGRRHHRQDEMHDAQLLARAFATYFHLANLCEENYRVSVLHSARPPWMRTRPSIR